ncbi:MAG TPA: helix-turn-helix domain-containing protein [Verrucomicrobiae bacterium]|nr:helix-turn-helix domain-containing protein [Verrucomicrobiae bacterium]
MVESTGSLRPVPAIDKAARVLRALADGGRPQGISELARALDVSKGTLRDVLLTLDAYGLVVRDPDTRFRLGPELRALADASTPDLRALAQPYLVSLMESFGETAILGVVHDGKLEIAARAEPDTDLHMTAPLGRRLPLNEGAHGNVITKGDAIGYDDEELFAGVRAAAAPIVDARGRKIAFVMVVGFKQRVDLRTLRRIGERCASAANALSRRIGAKVNADEAASA